MGKKKQRIRELETELKAIKEREKYYTESGRWDEMVPWFDFTDNERANAIIYWGYP